MSIPTGQPPAPGVRAPSDTCAAALPAFALSAALATLPVVWPRAADAFEVHPLVHRVEPHGKLSSSNVIVTNRRDQPLAVEFTAYALEYDGETVRRGAPADDELLVFPPSAIVAPGKVQAARLQWLGDPDLGAARSYLVAIEQLPAFEAAQDDASGVQVLLTFNVYVHVSPPGAEPRLIVRERSVESADGRSTLRMRIANEGNGNAYGSLIAFELDGDGRLARVLPEAVAPSAGELFFPPGFERELELPLPGGEWPTSTSIDVVYDD